MNTYRSSLLTIGTEVSSGQIVNTNAAWLADQLKNIHFDPICHLTVADVEADIKAALDYLAPRSDFIFVTGGLGPTSDDLTRDVVSRWASDELIFDEASWQHIQARFQQLGIVPPESNRQQCYFPSRGQIIANPKGTANAFSLTVGELFVCCLPGPPEEIKAIWQKSLCENLRARVKDSDPYQLFRWQCLGLSESALGEIVEKVIQGSPLVSGYRPHIPYVEIKIWCRQSQIRDQAPTFQALDEALRTWTIVRNDEDLIDAFFTRMGFFDRVTIVDAGSQGAMGERIGLALSQGASPTLRIDYQGLFHDPLPPTPEVAPACLQLLVSPVEADGTWTIAWKTQDSHRQKTLKLPFRKDPKRWDRERRFVCEMSLAAWSRTSQGELLA